MTGSDLPRIEIYSHMECAEISMERIGRQTIAALPWCLASRGSEAPLLGELKVVEISLVSDEMIASVHGEFMDDPTPTDVITFHHGEILVSIETARRVAPLHGISLAEETLLYIIHGLLHLNGHTDLGEPHRSVMRLEQEAILKQILAGPQEVSASNQ